VVVLNPPQISYPSSSKPEIPVLLQLRELSRFRYWLADQIGDCKRKLLTILDRVFPEYERLFSSVFIQSLRTLLLEAVSAQEFADFDLHELADLHSRSSRGHFGSRRLDRSNRRLANPLVSVFWQTLHNSKCAVSWLRSNCLKPSKMNWNPPSPN